jgi:hypothetical protein
MITPMVSFATSDDATTDSTDATDTTTTTTTEATNPVDTSEEGLTEEQVEDLREEEKAEALKAAVVEEGGNTIEDNYNLVAKNSTVELYLNEEDFSIIVRDIATGSVMRSLPDKDALNDELFLSPVSINVADQNSAGSWQQVKLESRYGILGDDVEKTLTKQDNGFTLHINYTKMGIVFNVYVTLDDEGLHIEVPMSELEENNSAYKLSTIYLYPFLGATKLDFRDASMFLPDGSGILANLTDYEEKYGSTLYSMQFYGSDIGKLVSNATSNSVTLGGKSVSFTKSGEKATMPVFGMIYNDTKMAMLGIVEEGAENSYCIYTLNSYANWNLVTARYHVRDQYLYPTSQSGNQSILKNMPDIEIEKIKVTYLFTSGDEADYAGLAVKYREKLQKDGVLTQKSSSATVKVDFLGVDKENFLVFKRNVVMTTIDDISNIFSDMQARGIKNVFAVYRGWQDGGVNAVPVSGLDIDSDIGSESDLKDLINTYSDKGVTFALEQDAQTLNPSLSGEKELEKVNQRDYEDNVVSDVFNTFAMIYPSKTLEYCDEFAEEAVEAGVENALVVGLAENVFSYAESSTVYVRRQCVELYSQALQNMKNAGLTLALQQPNAYAWQYADAYTNLVMGSSSYIYADQEVPFLAIVLKGSIPMYSEYVNFEAEKTKFFLELIDQGVYPSFLITNEDPSYLENTNSNYIYSSEYELYKDTIQEYYEAVTALAEKTQDAYIADHEELQSGVNVTTYDNGVKVYTNYNEEAVVVDGLTIDALSYEVR